VMLAAVGFFLAAGLLCLVGLVVALIERRK